DRDSVIFFFSSRRRHTRFSRDWSSDVCSSDLPDGLVLATGSLPRMDGLQAANPGQPLRGMNDPRVISSWDLFMQPSLAEGLSKRSEERRVGKECRSGWSADQEEGKERERR